MLFIRKFFQKRLLTITMIFSKTRGGVEIASKNRQRVVLFRLAAACKQICVSGSVAIQNWFRSDSRSFFPPSTRTVQSYHLNFSHSVSCQLLFPMLNSIFLARNPFLLLTQILIDSWCNACISATYHLSNYCVSIDKSNVNVLLSITYLFYVNKIRFAAFKNQDV
jgi:hypothetical protein